MKSIIITSIIALTAISCSRKIDISDRYDPAESFQVINQYNPEFGELEFEILVNDPRHDKFLLWLESNNNNWKPTHNTHAGYVIIFQDNFRLLLYKNNDMAVVIVKDDDNIQRYYIKSLETGELDFLDE